MNCASILFALSVLLASTVRAELTDEEISTFGGCYFARVTAAPLWRMRDQDGVIREFEPGGSRADTLVSRGGWTAKLGTGGRVTVRSHPGIEPRLVFTFENGTLVHLNADGRDCNFHYPNPIIYDDGEIVPLWPDDAPTAKEIKDMAAEQWGFGDRWRFGFASPNQAGAVLATLALVCLACALKSRKTAWRVSASLGTALFLVLLALTASRGALVAVVVGGIPLVACHVRNSRRAREIWTAVRRSSRLRMALVAVGLCVALVAFGGFVARHRMLGDRRAGDAVRIEVLRMAPQMFCDAPGGWGSRADVGRAYTDWYQPMTNPRRMLGLVSDHLTNVVALGWIKGGLYVFAWVAGLLALWMIAWRGGTALPAVAWTVLGVTAAFNVVLFARYVSWIALATLPLLFQEKALRAWRFWIRPCALGLLGGVLVTGGMIIAGRLMAVKTPQVSCGDGGIIVNGKTASTWLVADPDVLGLVTVKKEMRSFYEQFPKAQALGYAERLDAVPLKDLRRLVLSGRRCEEFLTRYRAGELRLLPREVVFLAPPFGCSSIPVALHAQCRVRVVIGEFAARYYEDYAKPRKWITRVKGAEVYIPGWMRFCAQEI